MRIGLLGTLAVYDQAGRPVRIGGYRVRMLLILLALDVGRVVPAYSLIERLWEDEPPANSGNALQSLVSRLRTALRQRQPVARRMRLDHLVARAALAQRGTQPGDQRLQRIARVGRGLVLPVPLDQ